jgi:hypothetical protein
VNVMCNDEYRGAIHGDGLGALGQQRRLALPAQRHEPEKIR